MSQNDMSIANQAGAPFRADLNSALQALVSQSSGTTEPTTTYAFQPWYDTTNNILKYRNAANNAWVTYGKIVDTAAVDFYVNGTKRLEVLANGDTNIEGTGALKINVGTTAQRPGTPATGQIRFNTTTSKFEGWDGAAWGDLTDDVTPGDGTVTEAKFDSTGASAGDVLTADGSGGATYEPPEPGGINTITRIVITSTSTYNPSSGLQYADVEICGGGGSGGGINNGVGGGGGGGGYTKKRFTAAEIGSSQSVTIGAGGTATTGADGNSGGTTTFGSLLTATGGGGGKQSVGSALSIGEGGDKGSGSGGDINATGSAGTPGIQVGSSPSTANKQACSGNGGSSFFGGGGRGRSDVNTDTSGQSASSPGAGGAGAHNPIPRASGAGAAGICIVTEYRIV